MRRFMKVSAFLMLGLGLAAAPGYWTYVNYLSASTLTEQLVFDGEISGNNADVGGDMSVYLTPDMNPIQIVGRLDVAPFAGPSRSGISIMNVTVWSGDRQVWAATAAVPAKFATASNAAQPTAINVTLGTLYVSAAGDFSIRGSVDGNKAQVQRLSLEIRRDVISIKWGFFGIGILLILGAIILYRVVDSNED